MKFCFPVLALFILFSGCITPYQPNGFSGGYKDTRIGKNKFVVSFYGNGYTSNQTVQTYLLYRCAELTVKNGYDFFLISGGGVTGSTSRIYQGTVTGSGSFSGSSIPVTRHTGTVTIVVFKKSEKPDNPSLNNAHEILKYVGPEIKRPEDAS